MEYPVMTRSGAGGRRCGRSAPRKGIRPGPVGLSLLLATLFACAGLHEEGATFTESQVKNVFVKWREGERRRDEAMAREALIFECGSDEDRFEEEFEALADATPGPVRAAVEIHLPGHPADWGPGEYLFLEPVQGRYVTVRATIRARDGRPRIVYEPPWLDPGERRESSSGDAAILRMRRRAAFWEGLDEDELAEEADKLVTMLRHQVLALAYAERENLSLQPFQPHPGTLLAEVEPLDPEGLRTWVVGMLK